MTNDRQTEHADGRVELVDTSRIDASPLCNHDLAPVPLARRTWSTSRRATPWNVSLPATVVGPKPAD